MGMGILRKLNNNEKHIILRVNHLNRHKYCKKLTKFKFDLEIILR